MPTFAVRYVYADDAAGRDRHRDEHMAFLAAKADQKRLLLSGRIVSDTAPGAMMVVSAESEADAAALSDEEPFFHNGLVAQREISEWDIVFGKIQG